MNRVWSVLAALALAMVFSAPAMASDYKADPVHSFVVFDVHHLGAGYVYGTFAGPTGPITFDPSDLSQSAFDLTVQTDSLETRNTRRDQDLKGPDFFDVRQFPTMTFKSTSAKKTGENMMEITGGLTIKGVTKSITVPMVITGTGKGMRGEVRTGFRTTFTINRTDFGINADPEPVIGNEIHVVVAIEAIQQ
jgi:polyisoprenoid-binding protein YceI